MIAEIRMPFADNVYTQGAKFFADTLFFYPFRTLHKNHIYRLTPSILDRK